MLGTGKTILIVDDEPLTRSGIHKTLETWSAGKYKILSTDNGAEALEIIRSQVINLLITDIRMPEITGLQLVESMQKRGQKPVVIVISGHADFHYAQSALQLGVVNYLVKPIQKRKLLEAVEGALQIEEEWERVETLERMADPQLLQAKLESQQYSEPVQQAVRYVEQHLQEPLGMREVAMHIHLNPSYFSALFKEQTGFTFSEYVTRSRLQRAKELLLQTRLPISDIAEQVGYQTPKYFIKLFKEYEGKSPSQFRKELKQEDDEI
ncbi:response regulator [Paenibacillus turpanensis]|uniref:response regulator n=1 Tax=Paenibacillus turpanensis TaxID=2689078 RepID=UPI001409FC8C|nr:response regulator [Paenibacillus turpanensis]